MTELSPRLVAAEIYAAAGVSLDKDSLPVIVAEALFGLGVPLDTAMELADAYPPKSNSLAAVIDSVEASYAEHLIMQAFRKDHRKGWIK